MARELRYEFSASAEPPEPTKTSTLYTGQIPYPVGGGYYAVKAWEDGNNSGVVRKSFGIRWTPADTTTALWLDENDTGTITKDGSNLVSQWNDKSGNSRNATASGTARPLWSAGKLTFDGSNDVMALPYAFGNASNSVISILVVGKQRASQAGVYLSQRAYEGGGWTLRNNMYFHTGYSPNLSTAINNNQTIVEVVRNGLSVKLGTNGTLASPVTMAGYSATAINTYIGAEQSGNYSFLDGDISEIVILPTDDINIVQKVEGYLAWKWDGINGNTALVTALPSNHPYKSAPPTT